MLKTLNPSTHTLPDQATMASFGTILNLKCVLSFSNSQCANGMGWMVILTDNVFFERTIYPFSRCDFQLGEMILILIPSTHWNFICFISRAIVNLKQFDFNKCRMYPSWLKKEERRAAVAIRHVSIAVV